MSFKYPNDLETSDFGILHLNIRLHEYMINTLLYLPSDDSDYLIGYLLFSICIY